MSQEEMFEKPKPKQKIDLYRRARVLESEILVLKEDLEQLKYDFTYDKDDNPLGLPKADVKTSMKIAQVDAANSFEKLLEKRYAQQEFEEEFKELTGYDN